MQAVELKQEPAAHAELMQTCQLTWCRAASTEHPTSTLSCCTIGTIGHFPFFRKLISRRLQFCIARGSREQRPRQGGMDLYPVASANQAAFQPSHLTRDTADAPDAPRASQLPNRLDCAACPIGARWEAQANPPAPSSLLGAPAHRRHLTKRSPVNVSVLEDSHYHGGQTA